MYDGSITDVKGIEVGHAQDYNAETGCTVILCKDGAVAGVDVRGSAPGTRETDLIRPGNLVDKIHGVILCGGSAFGLAAADGVMRYLEENGVGFNTGVTHVPIVAAAVLYDLEYGDYRVRPDAEMGYQACMNIRNGSVLQGSVGAGTGATVGKVLGMTGCMKGGIGTSSVSLPDGVVVGAVVVVNAFGDIVEPGTGRILAGARVPGQPCFVDTVKYIMKSEKISGFAGTNTTIGVIATNARLTKEQANKVASMAHDGLALSIRPVHTMMDGDTLFVMATGEKEADINVIGVAAAQVVAGAVVNGAVHANGLNS